MNFFKELLPEDCAVIIHNLFLNGYTERLSYNVVADALLYLENESDYLPWRAVYHHLNNMLSILEYRRSFFEVAVRAFIRFIFNFLLYLSI